MVRKYKAKSKTGYNRHKTKQNKTKQAQNKTKQNSQGVPLSPYPGAKWDSHFSKKKGPLRALSEFFFYMNRSGDMFFT